MSLQPGFVSDLGHIQIKKQTQNASYHDGSSKFRPQGLLNETLVSDLMPSLLSGDLGFHLQHLGIFTKVMAQYYTARTVLGIQHLHQKGIVYRDLKPENVMLDEHGRSRISDMGLACKVTPHLTGACGTRGCECYTMHNEALLTFGTTYGALLGVMTDILVQPFCPCFAWWHALSAYIRPAYLEP